MKQTRRASWIESWSNIAVGCGVALASQILIFPIFDIHIPLRDNLEITLLFTVISVVRSYCLRRLFEHLRVKGLLP